MRVLTVLLQQAHLILRMFKDKNGKEIPHDYVVSDGEHYSRMLYNTQNGTYLLSCTNGYVHNLTQEIMSNYETICPFKGNEHLFDCD